MRNFFLAWLSVLSLCTVSNAQSNDLNTQLDMAIKKEEPKIIGWRRYFHEHPELGNLEFKTADTIAKILRSFGLDVKTGIAKTGVVAILQDKTRSRDCIKVRHECVQSPKELLFLLHRK
jgi:hypothetical protein